MFEQTVSYNDIRVTCWEQDDYRLELAYHDSSEYVTFWLFHKSQCIFNDSDYLPSWVDDPIGKQSVADLLGFLSLEPTGLESDSDFFARHTQDQLAWLKSYGSELFRYALNFAEECDIEDGITEPRETIGDTTCIYNARSPHLRCAINPSGPCKGCIGYSV